MALRWRPNLRRAYSEEIADGTLKKDDLGVQTINGVSAQGTRYTRTIPAGQIGNDKVIVIVSERWYSPDLQIVVKSTRHGSTTWHNDIHLDQYSAFRPCGGIVRRPRGLYRASRQAAVPRPRSTQRSWRCTSSAGAPADAPTRQPRRIIYRCSDLLS